MAPAEREEAHLLCLRCRGAGHGAGTCTVADWTDDSEQFRWFFSAKRKELTGLLSTAARICERCRSLNLIELLRTDIPWTSPQDLVQAQEDGHPLIRKIGTAGNISFLSSCPVCVCLFALTPSPSSPNTEILLYPDWSWNRLAGENGTNLDTDEKRQYANCLLVALVPNTTILSFYIRGHRGDGLCMLENDLIRPG
jgi:hypothetical protein